MAKTVVSRRNNEDKEPVTGYFSIYIPENRRLLERAAKKSGMALSTFIRNAAMDRARQVLERPCAYCGSKR